MRAWQDRINPGGASSWGCHLNRDIPAILSDGGFHIGEMDSMYLPGTPKFAGSTCGAGHKSLIQPG